MCFKFAKYCRTFNSPKGLLYKLKIQAKYMRSGGGKYLIFIVIEYLIKLERLMKLNKNSSYMVRN